MKDEYHIFQIGNILLDNRNGFSLVKRSSSHVKGQRRGGVCVLGRLLEKNHLDEGLDWCTIEVPNFVFESVGDLGTNCKFVDDWCFTGAMSMFELVDGWCSTGAISKFVDDSTNWCSTGPNSDVECSADLSVSTIKKQLKDVSSALWHYISCIYSILLTGIYSLAWEISISKKCEEMEAILSTLGTHNKFRQPSWRCISHIWKRIQIHAKYGIPHIRIFLHFK